MLDNLAKKYKYENGVFLEVGKRGPKVSLNSNDMMKILMDYYPIEEVPQKLVEFSSLCKSKETFNEVSNTELITEIISEHDFVKDFRKVRIGQDQFIYHHMPNKVELVQSGYPSTLRWVEILIQYKNKELVQLKKRLAPLMQPKSSHLVTLEDVAKVIANSMNYSEREDICETLPGHMKPVTLSTSDELSLYKVDYEEVENPKPNATMMDFLSRVSDHEYLCAIIWIMFNGHKAPYIVYLYGTGGEGKSSFLNVLASQVGTYVAFQKNDKFSNFNMYGKAMIVLTENTDSHLLQDKNVKQLTGMSPVHCEQKHVKGGFTASLPGILFADANRMLKLKGEEAETRRLRLFKVSKPKYTEQLDMQTYEALLSEDFNSFLNYCRVCFEKVGSAHSWLVPASAQQLREYKNLTDKEFENRAEGILTKMFKDLNLEYNPGCKVPSREFWGSYFKLASANKKDYELENLKEYLHLQKQVTDDGEYVHGVVRLESNLNHTSFVMPTH